MKKVSKRTLRVLATLSLVAAAGLFMALFVSFARPSADAWRSRGFVLLDGSVGYLRADDKIGVAVLRGMPVIRLGRGAIITLRASNGWIPSVESGAIMSGALNGPTTTRNVHLFWLPLWIPLLLAGALAAFCFWRSRRAFRPGECPACGYDLSHLPGGRCPECGRVAAPPAIAELAASPT